MSAGAFIVQDVFLGVPFRRTRQLYRLGSGLGLEKFHENRRAGGMLKLNCKHRGGEGRTVVTTVCSERRGGQKGQNIKTSKHVTIPWAVVQSKSDKLKQVNQCFVE